MPSVITLMYVSGPDSIVEPDRVADGPADLGAELFCDPLGHRPCGQPAGLRVPDEPRHAQPQLEAQLRQLRALARAGLPGDDHDLVVADRREDRLAVDHHGQVGVGRDGQRRSPLLEAVEVAHDSTAGCDGPRRSSTRTWAAAKLGV